MKPLIKPMTILLLLIPLWSNAQHALKGLSLSVHPAQWFDQQLGKDKSELYAGVYEPLIRASAENHPYFINANWYPSSIGYRDQSFEKIELLYDVFRDLIIMHHHNSDFAPFPVLLHQDQVQWFTVREHLFVNYLDPAPRRPSGFYDQIFSGEKVVFLAKRVKIDRVDDGQIEIIAKDRYLIALEGDFQGVASGKALLKLMKPYKAALKPYIRKYKIRKFKAMDYQVLQALGKFCDHLITEP